MYFPQCGHFFLRPGILSSAFEQYGQIGSVLPIISPMAQRPVVESLGGIGLPAPNGSELSRRE
jgi:hypothetical protein